MRKGALPNVLFVTGKGGVGKTTVAYGLGLASALAGRRTVLVEMAPASERPGALGVDGLLTRHEVDPDQTLLQWLGELGGRLPARLLVARASFRLFAAAAPGARELLALVRILDLANKDRYQTVVVDAPASGHAQALWRAPATFASLARVGPIATKAKEVERLLRDPSRCSYIAVARPLELAVSETLELSAALARDLDRSLQMVVVNGVVKPSWASADLEALAGRAQDGLAETVLQLALATNARYRRERFQVARLKRARLPVLELPLLPERPLKREQLGALAAALQPLVGDRREQVAV